MKKHIQKIFLLLFLGIAQMGIAQSIGALSGYGGTRLDCGGDTGHFCGAALSVPASRSANEATLPIQLRKDESGHLVVQVLKSALTEDQDKINFKNKFLFYVEEDMILDASVKNALSSTETEAEDLVKIKQGIYPIISWDKFYLIRF